MTIYHINPKETITSILTEVQRSQEDLLRKRALRMFSNEIKIQFITFVFRISMQSNCYLRCN